MAKTRLEGHWRRWLIVIWLAACAACLWMRWGMIRWYALPDTDDNMRMAQVRALLGGQGWFDVRQYKLNPPAGFDMHFSRLVDLPIAAIELALRPFVGMLEADRWAAAVEPLLPLGLAMLGIALAVRRLVAPSAFALGIALMLCCATAMQMFMPLRVDHHGWQLALLVIGIAGLADPKRLRGGATLGLSSAASLVIGLELLPFLAICGAAQALRWVWRVEERARLAAYGASLAIGCALGFALFASNDNRVWRCDTLTPVWTSTMVAAGVVALALSFAPIARREWRLAAAGAGGAALALGFAHFFPQCLGRPEQVSAELYASWLVNIKEAKPLYAQAWNQAVSTVALPIVGVIGSLWSAWRARGTRDFEIWAPLALVTVTALGLVLWQTRAGPAAQLTAVPGATALAWALLPWLARHPLAAVKSAGAIAALLLVSGVGAQMLGGMAAAKPVNSRWAAINRANGRCPSLPAMRRVGRLPATTIFTFVDLGPRLINVTHHRAVAGPYHRNGPAILDVQHAFLGSPDRAHAIIHMHRATLLMTCPNMNESTVYRARAPGGFYARLAKGERFDWLTPIDLGPESPLLVWKVS